ncbi:MAG: hypothetical protein F6K17_28695 [Okeania sp. SIO3C4]|nr:hypothetical protein [Okeania sp. SIO3C4]
MNKNLSTTLAVFLAIYSALIITLPAIAKSTTSDRSQTIEVTPENLLQNSIAQTGRYAFSVIKLYYGRNILLKSVSTGNKFDVRYLDAIDPQVGDIIIVIMDDGKWTTLINERTGRSSVVTSVQKKY